MLSKEANRKSNGRIKTFMVFFFVLATAAVYLFIVLARAASTGITYDEAYTYYSYVRPLNRENFAPFLVQLFTTDSLANNHWLNTLAIKFVELVSHAYFNEFIIRLPVIFSGIAYVCLVCYMVLKRMVPVWSCGFFLFSYLVNEYFGLARGYGFSVFFILLALFFYLRWIDSEEQKNSQLTLCVWAFSFAATAITYSLVVMAAFGLVVLVHLLRQKRMVAYLKSQWPALVPAVAVCLLMALFQFNTSREGMSVPPAASGFFDGFAKGFTQTLFVDEGAVAVSAVIISIFFLGSCVLFYKKILASHFVLPFFVHMGLWVPLIFLGGYIPAQRSYLPFYIPSVFALIEIISWYKALLVQKNVRFEKILAPALTTLCCGFLALLFFGNVSLSSTRDFSENYPSRAIAENSLVNQEKYPLGEDGSGSAEIYFYLLKFRHYYQYDIYAGEFI